MRPTRFTFPCFLASCAAAAIALSAGPASAQVREVVVGITTTCPYENAIEGSCWSGAYFALSELEGVKAVEKSANGYTCTARVYLKDGVFPDPDRWASQFKASVGQTYAFRGIEVTARGTVSGADGGLVFRVPGVDQPIALRPLEHKLQWNSRKGAPRQPEPDERDAYQQLVPRAGEAKAAGLKVQLTGPLRKSGQGYLLEVREFILSTHEADSRPPG